MLQKQAIFFFFYFSYWNSRILSQKTHKFNYLLELCQQHYLGTKNNLFVRIVWSYQQITPTNSFSFVFHLKFVSSFN